ncbi:hypothetical protein ACFZCL_23395 [Streptomyces sp. NPDC008159]|uniref:hypothetical protein n=1 Tax=Streptomyces sp. NPDC008159 TaxID=3364817 RepID=UPI000F496DA5
MSFEEAWGHARTAATARQNATMRLNQAASSGGGNSGASDYKVTSPDLKAVGNEAQELFHRLEVDGFHAGAQTDAAAKSLAAQKFKTGSALWTAWDTWRSQVEALLSACAHIHNHLEDTVITHRNHEEELATNHSLATLDKHFK